MPTEQRDGATARPFESFTVTEDFDSDEFGRFIVKVYPNAYELRNTSERCEMEQRQAKFIRDSIAAVNDHSALVEKVRTLVKLANQRPSVAMWSHQESKYCFDGKLYENYDEADNEAYVAHMRWSQKLVEEIHKLAVMTKLGELLRALGDGRE